MGVFIFIVFSLLRPQQLLAVQEAELEKIEKILVQKSSTFLRGGFFKGQEVDRIYYTRFGAHKGPKGSVVILPGHRESSLDWTEWAYDMVQAGYSPVWAIDHSGQGLSGRFFNDTQLAHVHTYQSYYTDFKNWLNNIIIPDPVRSERLYLVMHSMGSLIGMYHLTHHASPFRAAVVVSPMYKIHPILLGGTEGVMYNVLKLACRVGLCYNYAYQGGRAPPALGQLNNLTGSPIRYRFVSWLRQRFPELRTNGASNQWMLSSIEQGQQLRKFDFSSILMPPMLLFHGTQDFIVSSPDSRKLCERWSFCRSHRVEGGKHGLHIEKDTIRQPLLDRSLQFFSSH